MATIESQHKRLEKIQPAPSEHQPDVIFVSSYHRADDQIVSAKLLDDDIEHQRLADESEDDFFDRVKAYCRERRPGKISLVFVRTGGIDEK